MAERVAIVTGVGGQDGYFLSQRLLRDGWTVHGVARQRASALIPDDKDEVPRWHVHEIDLLDPKPLASLVRRLRPHEVYNLAGQSSVSLSFADPSYTWRTNVDVVASLLEAIRSYSPHTRLYQSSSGEMYGRGARPGDKRSEDSKLNPRSPYAAAKAAAHLLCGTYRELGLRVACGILFNHESHRRPAGFLTRRVIDHVQRVRAGRSRMASIPPLRLGNLRAERDWGYAPDYVEGITLVLRQVEVRSLLTGEALPDSAEQYRDYVLATGRLHAVWQLVDRAFAIAGLELDWDMESDDVARWKARYRDTGFVAVEVDQELLRPTDPHSIPADPTRARRDLGWRPTVGLDRFLTDMLDHA